MSTILSGPALIYFWRALQAYKHSLASRPINTEKKKCCCTPLMCLPLCHLSRCETEELHPSLRIWCGLLIIQCNYYADEAVNCESLHLAATLAEFDDTYLIRLDPNTDHTHVFLQNSMTG